MVILLKPRKMAAYGTAHGLLDLVARRYATRYGGQNREIDGVVAPELVAQKNASLFKEKRVF